MTTDSCPITKDHHNWRHSHHGHGSDGLYGLAFIGAAVYYIHHAATFGAGVIGFLKALVWPAFLIYKVMEYLNM
jgi:hypothetical protein